MMKRLQIISGALCLLLLAACAKTNDEPYKDGKIHIAAINGNTMMGLGQLNNAVGGDPNTKYTITKVAAPDAIIAGLANGSFDAACLPANNAAIVFNSGSVDVKLAVIVGLNIMYILQKAGTPPITGIGDLAGKTIHSPGQGSTPEFALRYLFARNNINDVKIEFETEASTIAAGLKVADSRYDYAILPQPAATVATSGPGAAVYAFNLSDEWKKYNPKSDIVTSVLIVRTAFLKNNKAVFDQFLADYRQSIAFMADERNLDTAAGYVVDMGIVPALPIAKAALPKCNLTYIDKTGMKPILSDFYQVLYDQNPRSIGGKIPSDTFYYQ